MSNFQKDPLQHPARVGMPWDDDEVIKLLTSIKNKKTIPEIAKEHQRTIGAINSARRKLATNYWLNDKKSIEEISIITGLTKKEIENTIKTKTVEKNFKNVTDETSTDMKEIITLLKDIQSKLSYLVDKFQ
jgi:ABC-type taurine transport system substrate-binding protein